MFQEKLANHAENICQTLCAFSIFHQLTICDVKARNISKKETKIRELSREAVNQTTWVWIVGFCVDGEAASNSTLQMNFKNVWLCIVTDFSWIKPTDALSSNFIGITTLHVLGSLSAHHQEFLAAHRLWYNFCSYDELPAPGSRRSS
jgi:hypothetical protein